MSFSILAFFCYSIVHKTELVAVYLRELCIYNKIGMHLIVAKMKILVSKVDNHWDAIIIFRLENHSHYLTFSANYILKSPEVMQGFGMQF